MRYKNGGQESEKLALLGDFWVKQKSNGVFRYVANCEWFSLLCFREET